MGGDHGPRVTVPAACRALSLYPDLHIILVGQADILQPLLLKQRYDQARLQIQPASQVVAMDESPALALRNKKDSSLRVALNLVKEGRAGACVSAGNTGALMATARFVLKTITGVDRPAITTRLPTRTQKVVRVLDLGANVDSTAEHLYQFAVMGSVLSQAVDGIAVPKVGLLNVGEEDIKGNEQVKKTAELLNQSTSLHYIGFVEGTDLFLGDVDVVVCDGFVGNVTLKACEGIAKLIAFYLKQEFKANFYSRLIAFFALPILKRLTSRVDPKHHNGATLIGLNGIVVKSHGSAGVAAFVTAITEAVTEMDHGVLEKIQRQVSQVLQQGGTK